MPGLETTLTLTGLAAHNSINISFLLAIIDSWDRSFSANGSDLFNVSIDGNIIFSESFSTHPASSFVQTYDAPSGGLLTPSSFVDLGFRDTNRDSAYDMGADSIFTDISHTGDTLVIGLFASGGGWQGGVDESWAIDNLRVEINTVPEPSTILLLATGFINLIGFRRKFN